jgi:hypothetical protein
MLLSRITPTSIWVDDNWRGSDPPAINASMESDLATARISLACHKAEALLSFAISANSTASAKPHAKIERSPAIIKTRLTLGDLVLPHGREISGKAHCSG